MTAVQKSVQIDVRGLCKQFADHVILNQLTLRVNPGEIFVLMGPSGTGKSVFLKLLAGLDQPTAGSIHINGIALEEVRRQQMFVLGLVFQAGALFNSMSVFDNLALYFREPALCSEDEIARRIAHVLKLLNLEASEYLMPSDLSGGMKKRVALARGLLMQPDVLLFDEPTSELDPISAASITELIGYVNRTLKITTVIVSHDLALAKSIADHIGVLQNGKIDEIYTKESLLNSKNTFVQNFLNPKINIQHPNFGTLLP